MSRDGRDQDRGSRVNRDRGWLGAVPGRRLREQPARSDFIYSVLRYFQSFVVMQHDLFGPSSDFDERSRSDIELYRPKVYVSIKTGSSLNLDIHRLKCHRTTKNRLTEKGKYHVCIGRKMQSMYASSMESARS